MSSRIQGLLSRLKADLSDLYGARLRGLYLFGSYARGDEDAESDVDLLIVLDRVARYGDELELIGSAIARWSLEYGVSVSVVLKPEAEWHAGESMFLRNVRAEAVPA